MGMCKVLGRWRFCILQCCVSYIKVAISVEIYSTQRPFYHVIGPVHTLMDLSMFDIATVGLPSDSADFGGRAAWESPQPCRKSIFYTWSVRVFSEQVHFKTSQLLPPGLLVFAIWYLCPLPKWCNLERTCTNCTISSNNKPGALTVSKHR